jgi:hypothetical protein
MRRVPSFVPRSFHLTVRELIARTRASNLEWLTHFYRTDKGAGSHGYASIYDEHFRSRRKSTRRLLEVGIGGYDDETRGGASLRVWQRYFPKAEIVGIDLYPKAINGVRIRVETCDQGDNRQMLSLAERHGPFDIVIDDGSHIGRHTIGAFYALFPALRDGGIYVIEDLHTSYDAEFEGGAPGLPGTGIALVKHLLDALQFDEQVGRVDAHQGIAFIFKGTGITRARDRDNAATFWNGPFKTLRVE